MLMHRVYQFLSGQRPAEQTGQPSAASTTVGGPVGATCDLTTAGLVAMRCRSAGLLDESPRRAVESSEPADDVGSGLVIRGKRMLGQRGRDAAHQRAIIAEGGGSLIVVRIGTSPCAAEAAGSYR